MTGPRYPVLDLVGVEVGRYAHGWGAWRDGRRLPLDRPRYKVRRASDGYWLSRSLHSLVWHAGPGPDAAWDYAGLEVPGLGNYRLDGEPGEWLIRSYAHRSPLYPGTPLATFPHEVDERPVVNLVTDWGERVTWQLSRVVLVAHQGWPPAPDAKHCRHLNGDPFDDRPENLAWGSASENAQDRQAHGMTRGILPGGRKPELELVDEVAA